MTINAIALQLLTHFAWEERQIPDDAAYPGRNAAVALAMNGALQEVFSEASPWVRFEEKGALLFAPTAVTITVTNGSTSAIVTSGWATWMAGCAIVINGSAFDNRITNDGSAVVLKTPHDGPTGSTSAMVYQDCVTLSADVVGVCEPVKANGRKLGPFNSGEYPTPYPRDDDYGLHRRMVVSTPPLRVAERIGRPLGFAVETWTKDASTAPRPRLRIQPAPDVAGLVEYNAALAPPVVISDLASTNTLPIPLQYVQSIFYPIAVKRLSVSAFFLPGNSPESVDDEYRAALQLLKDITPKKQSGASFTSTY